MLPCTMKEILSPVHERFRGFRLIAAKGLRGKKTFHQDNVLSVCGDFKNQRDAMKHMKSFTEPLLKWYKYKGVVWLDSKGRPHK